MYVLVKCVWSLLRAKILYYSVLGIMLYVLNSVSKPPCFRLNEGPRVLSRVAIWLHPFTSPPPHHRGPTDDAFVTYRVIPINGFFYYRW